MVAKIWFRCFFVVSIFTIFNGVIELLEGRLEDAGVAVYHFVCVVIRLTCIYIVERFVKDLQKVGEPPAPMLAMAVGINSLAVDYTVSQEGQQQQSSQNQQRLQSQDEEHS